MNTFIKILYFIFILFLTRNIVIYNNRQAFPEKRNNQNLGNFYFNSYNRQYGTDYKYKGNDYN